MGRILITPISISQGIGNWQRVRHSYYGYLSLTKVSGRYHLIMTWKERNNCYMARLPQDYLYLILNKRHQKKKIKFRTKAKELVGITQANTSNLFAKGKIILNGRRLPNGKGFSYYLHIPKTIRQQLNIYPRQEYLCYFDGERLIYEFPNSQPKSDNKDLKITQQSNTMN